MKENYILVVYASQGGSTAGIAKEIGKVLADQGARVDVLPVKEVKDLSPYTAVVTGSAIQGAKLLPESLDFIKTNQAELSKKPFAAFLVCITLSMKGSEKQLENVKKWLDPVRVLVKPLNEGFFGGHINFKELPKNFAMLMFRLVTFLGIFPKGDKRDWEAVRAWAKETYGLLSS